MYFGSYFFFQVASSQIHVTLERKDVWPSSVSANMPVTAVGMTQEVFIEKGFSSLRVNAIKEFHMWISVF